MKIPSVFNALHLMALSIGGERLRGKRQAWCLLQVKLCDPCLSALKWFVYHARRYTSAWLFFTFIIAKDQLSSVRSSIRHV